MRKKGVREGKNPRVLFSDRGGHVLFELSSFIQYMYYLTISIIPTPLLPRNRLMM
jgi:hypothetical protein